jgi:hypothetical protein
MGSESCHVMEIMVVTFPADVSEEGYKSPTYQPLPKTNQFHLRQAG